MGRYQTNRLVSQRKTMALARIHYEASKLKEVYKPEFVTCKFINDSGKKNLECNLHFNIIGTECEAKIVFNGIDPPKCWLLSPTFDDPQHIYKDDGSLCLYDPKNNEWTSSSRIYNTFVPWCMEWVVFQMLYELTGRWQHPERHPGSFSDKELHEFCKKYGISFEEAKKILDTL